MAEVSPNGCVPTNDIGDLVPAVAGKLKTAKLSVVLGAPCLNVPNSWTNSRLLIVLEYDGFAGWICASNLWQLRSSEAPAANVHISRHGARDCMMADSTEVR